MSRWTKIYFLVLLFAANAAPMLACQNQGFSRFPKTLQEAIVPVDMTRRPAARDRKRVTGIGDSKNQNRSIDSRLRKSGTKEKANTVNLKRMTPAKKVSSNRVMGNDGSTAPMAKTANFEFGTVMMFPANAAPEKLRVSSNAFQRPGKNANAREPERLGQPAGKFSNGGELSAGFRLASEAKASPPAADQLLSRVAPDSELPGDLFLSTAVYGPLSLRQDSHEEFEIVIDNPTAQRATNIIVQLKTPDGITISKLDRQAWLDYSQRTVSWKIDEIPSGYKTSIRFSAVSGVQGRHRQRVTVGMDNVFQGETKFDTLVTPPGEQDQSTTNF